MAALTAADAAFFRSPTGVSKPEELRRIYVEYPSKLDAPFNRFAEASYPDYERLQKAFVVLGNVAAYDIQTLRVQIGRGPVEARVAFVSSNYFQVLGTSLILGKTFNPTNSVENDLLVVSNHFWRTKLGGTPRVIGTLLLIGGNPFRISGVAPANFSGISNRQPDFWAALESSPRAMKEPERLSWKDVGFLKLVIRPFRDVTERELSATGALTIDHLNKSDPLRYWTRSIALGQLSSPETAPTDAARTAARLAVTSFAGILVVLLALCASNLVLLATIGRFAELAVRVTVGARMADIARMLCAESLLMSIAGSCLGIILGAAVTVNMPWPDDIGNARALLDWRFFAIGVWAAVAASIVATVVPLAKVAATELLSFLQLAATQTIRQSRLASAVAVLTIAASVFFLCGAFIFGVCIFKATRIELGFRPNRLMAISAELKSDDANVNARDNGRASQAFFQEALRSISSLPGAEIATISIGKPFGSLRAAPVVVDADKGRSARRSIVLQEWIGQDYFKTMGIELISGRTFLPEDFQDQASSVVINQSMQRELWSTSNPLGKCLSIGSGSNAHCVRVVGIVADTRVVSVKEKPRSMHYLPLGPNSFASNMSLFVRYSGNAVSFASHADLAVRRLRPDLNEVSIVDFRDVAEAELGPLRLGLRAFAVAGLGVLLMASLNLYGLLLHRVAERKRELGVRIAMGASPLRIMGTVLRGAVIQALPGLILGLAAGTGLERLVRPLLFDTGGTMLVASIAILCVVCFAVLAAAFPVALRAATIDPFEALRAN